MFQRLLDQGVRPDAALENVLRAGRNPDRETFDRLVDTAIDKGLTLDQAREIVNRLKTEGACK